jgi:MoxR-like ATPase
MDGRTSASVVRAILTEVPVQNLVTPKTLKEAA